MVCLLPVRMFSHLNERALAKSGEPAFSLLLLRVGNKSNAISHSDWGDLRNARNCPAVVKTRYCGSNAVIHADGEQELYRLGEGCDDRISRETLHKNVCAFANGFSRTVHPNCAEAASKELQDGHIGFAIDLVCSALDILDDGVKSVYYSASDVHPLRNVIVCRAKAAMEEGDIPQTDDAWSLPDTR
jgi:hypothetical protein